MFSNRYLHTIVLLILQTFLFSCSSSSTQNSFIVSKVVDGNTIQLENGVIAKLVGVAPTPSSQAWLEKNVLNQVVRLLPDQQIISTDYVGAYLFNLNGSCINSQMLHEKIALVDVSYNYDSLNTFKQYNKIATTKVSTNTPSPSPSPSTSLPDLVKQVESAVFFVVREDNGSVFDQAGFGSGFFINENGVAVTNYHVYDKYHNGFIKLLNGEKYRINSILAESEEFDYVIFAIENPDNTIFPYLTTTSNPPEKGNDIFVIGNPRGLESSVTKGIISNVNSEKEGYIQIDAAVSPGNSGGPVFDMTGEIVGLVTFKRMDCDDCNFALDIHKISELNQYTPH